MFLSEMSLGIFFLIKTWISPSKEYLENKRIAENEGKLSKYQYFYLLIPATCDFTATGV